MKKLITTLLLCFSLLQGFGQHYIYQDAEKLATAHAANTTADKDAIYKTLTETYGMSSEDIADNPFLSFWVPNIAPIEAVNNSKNNKMRDTSTYGKLSAEEMLLRDTPPIANGAVAEINATTGENFQAIVINAVATFMAERFRQEVMQMGVDNLFKYIHGRDSLIFKKLFPKTFEQIALLHQTHEYYSVDFIYLKQLVANDISSMGKSVSNIFSNRIIIGQLFPNIDPKTADIMVMGSGIVKGILANQSVPNIITNVTTQTYNNADIKEITRTIYILNNALQKQDDNNIYIIPGTDILTGGFTNGSKESFFFGLLYHVFKTDPALVKTAAFLNANNTTAVKADLANTINIATSLNNARNYLKSLSYNITKPEELIELAEKLSGVVQNFADLDMVRNKVGLNTTGIQKVTDIVTTAVQFYKIGKDDYKMAIARLVSTISPYVKDPKINRTIIFISQLLAIEKNRRYGEPFKNLCIAHRQLIY